MGVDIALICYSDKAKYFLSWGLTYFPKIGSDSPSTSVVPAQAGTQTPSPRLQEKKDNDQHAKAIATVAMGPGIRQAFAGTTSYNT
jgi:hypothetical protein